MKSKTIWTSLILIAAIGFLGLAGANAVSMMTGRPTAAGVIDVQMVFESLKEKMHIEANLKSRLEQLNLDEQEQKQNLQEIKSDLDILAPDSPAFNEKQNQLEQKAIELQTWRTFQTQKLSRERGLQIERLYRKLIESVGTVAKQNGFDLILFKEKPVDFSGAKPEALNTLIQVRKVLWSASDLDLTDQVTQLMNNEFSNMTQ